MTEQVKIFQPSGSLDATKSQAFRQEVTAFVDNGTKIVLIDLKNVTFMDSSGLGALVLAFKTLRAANSKLVLCSINEQIRILFELTGMDKVFEIFTDRHEFEKSLMTKIS
ncbi:STAS domain-containing protein [Calothrix sp. UHCC 0171]|nr:STAS domain-containing protein [Calothrix sp. UHCC 0171]MEA5569775.1 STAS domain-containing protein [Calothrix sp. UHCC 0171]